MVSLELIRRFQQISHLFNQHSYSQVVKLCVNSLSVKDLPAEIAFMYAMSLRHLNEYDKAESVFSDAVSVHHAFLTLHTAYGHLLLERGKVQDALELFMHCLQKQPEKAETYFNCAKALRLLGHNQQALEMSKGAYARRSDINYAIALADDFTLNQQFAEAENLYISWLQQYPQDVRLLNNFGNLKRRLGDIKRAIQLFEQASGVNNVTVLRNLAACYVLDGQNEAAVRCYRKALELAPDDVTTYQEFTAFLWQQGAAEPFDLIERRLAMSGSSFALRAAYVKILLQINLPEKAKLYLQPLLKQFPTDSEVLILATSVYRDTTEFAQAEKYARQALKAQPANSNIPARSELAYTLLAQHKAAEAAHIYRQLIVDDPLNQGWWTTLSSSLKQLGDDSAYAWLCNYELVHCAFLSDQSRDSLLPADFNQQLMPLLNDLHRNVRPPLGLSLQKGSQTFENLFDKKDALVQQLKEAILQQARKFIADLKPDSKHPFLSRLSQDLVFQGSWSVQLRRDGFHKSHFHPMGWLSGVYYVDVPHAVEHEGQGWLVFGRPDIPNIDYAGDYALKPQPGMLVLFPSFMWHGTNPFKSTSNRLTVAFDIVPKLSANQ
uniref:putative 2OG-Fe(II) oxygenase n=1 Tax=Rheinheimera sp. TaxID=1869214 RepID=UPI0040473894